MSEAYQCYKGNGFFRNLHIWQFTLTMKLVAILNFVIFITGISSFDQIDSNNIFDSVWNQQSCSGTLKLYNSQGQKFRYFHHKIVLKFNKKWVFNFRFYESEKNPHSPGPQGIKRATITGNCCWKIYHRSHFFGRSQILHPGLRRNVHIRNIRSIKKYIC